MATFSRKNRAPYSAALTVISASVCLAVAPTASAQSKSERVSVDHLLKIKQPKDVEIDPSGKWVAYTVQSNDIERDERATRIWMSPVAGGEAIPLTADYADASTPRWNPDGTSLAFLGQRGREEDKDDLKTQVWLLNRLGGEAQQMTSVKQGVEDFIWSPDGKSMVLVIQDPKPEDETARKSDDRGEKHTGKKSAKDDDAKPWVIDRLQFKADYVGYLDRRRTHLYLHDGNSDPVQLTSGDYDDEDPQWSPDGSTIAFVSKRDGDPDANTNSDIWTVAADPKAKKHPLTQITTNKGADFSPAWSPDGATIAYVSITEPEKLWYATQHLAIIDVEGGADAKILTADFDRMVFEPEFAANGEDIYFIAEDGGAQPLMKFNRANGALSRATPGDVAVDSFSLHKGGAIALLQSTHWIPWEVYVLDDAGAKKISTLNDDLLKSVQFANVERLKVAGYNGDMVESFVYTPPNYRKNRAYPTIFVLHGGPTAQHDVSFHDWAQLFAANGYIAVLPNPHGSTGYGHDFTYALNRQWGVPDFADVDAIADHLVETGVSKADQLGVGGWSYGGILTNYVITKSTRFAGAVTGASEVNHRANYGHDIYQNAWEVELGLPWEDIEAWESINPFNDLGKVTTPTLVMGGKEDWNVPIQNSEQLYQVLKRRGIETQLVVYPGEFHSLKRPSFLRDRNQRFLDWFDKYVKP